MGGDIRDSPFGLWGRTVPRHAASQSFYTKSFLVIIGCEGKIEQKNGSKCNLNRGFLPQRVFPVFTQMSRIALAQSV